MSLANGYYRVIAITTSQSLKWKILAVFCAGTLIVVLIGIFAFAYLSQAFGMHRLDSAAVVTQVKQLNQLVTVKYSIQRVVGLREPKVPMGEESILIMVQGEALAGVDLSSLGSRDIAFGGKHSVIVTLPRAKLLHAFLDEKQTKVWDRRITWWTPWIPYDPDLEHKARLEALDDLRAAALNMGILDQAQTNAQIAIRD
ncbi:MAG: DUF4230 domain-containing protein, partial [Acidobacteriaceae bacterium]|nr:DUF4230 domain-containing protein [Acidobacteriaceae bacterium]